MANPGGTAEFRDGDITGGIGPAQVRLRKCVSLENARKLLIPEARKVGIFGSRVSRRRDMARTVTSSSTGRFPRNALVPRQAPGFVVVQHYASFGERVN